jgi:hypothetical protein
VHFLSGNSWLLWGYRRRHLAGQKSQTSIKLHCEAMSVGKPRKNAQSTSKASKFKFHLLA